ncbi:MAG: sensor histidine kinase N-terminal domain-containing protein [Gammaproteobacteria bacterium]|nr:sensor histidine kinase N-terminal domain-containing protein [Gammaproteobacteria bacterium]MCP5136179.1 sensor histidine kinase N-terminal domain-containing protein [Gammaproteobacteria bacterium]
MAPSIRRRLLWMIVGVVTLVWTIAGWRVYVDARHEVDEVYDANLAQSARVLLGLLAHELEQDEQTRSDVARVMTEIGPDELEHNPTLGAVMGAYTRNLHDHMEWHERGARAGHKYESKLALRARYPDGEILLSTPNAPKPQATTDGFSEYRENHDSWRMFSIADGQTGLVVQVSERIEVRRELVRYITANSLMPLLASLPIMALLLWLAVGQGLRPLARVAKEVEHREPDALQPIPTNGSPREVRPLVNSLNDLFLRLDSAMQAERRFTADAAHELRTPLAALRTQAQVALREQDPARRTQALSKIQQGVDRATHLVEQLLALARADSSATSENPLVPLDLDALLAELLAEMADQVIGAGAELEFERGGGTVHGDSGALRILARNLIENAVRYSGNGARITISTRKTASGIDLRVSDNGPGIRPEDRSRVLQRFHRGDSATLFSESKGSGLGLSIVQRIVEMHHAALSLEDGAEGIGLTVRVRFPTAD